jgi:PKHD-type hydroxylase
MKNIWEVWTGALSADECATIVERGERYPAQPSTIGFETSKRADPGYRTSVVRWLDAYAEHEMVERFMRLVHSSNRTNFGVEIHRPFELQFTEYHGTAQGKYDWHQDVWLESDRAYDRKLSVVVQLSAPQDYAGGEFDFFGAPSPDAAFTPQGSVLIFPSWLQHRVRPVTRGLRRSLVSWVEGPRWR